MKKILVPVDFSKDSKRALRFGAELAAKSGAVIDILHANTTAAYLPLMPEYYSTEVAEMTTYEEGVAADVEDLKTSLKAYKKFENLDIQMRIEEGFLHTSINAAIEADNCDLVVMGTKGATGATEFFVGSNTEKVIRTAKCPVLVVPNRYGEFKLQTVVLASTLRPDQGIAFVELAKFQQYFNFEVKVLYLNDPAMFGTMAELEQAVDNFSKSAGLQNVEIYRSSSTFNEDQAILMFAKEVQADMIAMATHQRQGLSHMMFGSLTEDTANHSEIPVLCIPITK